MSWSGLSCLSLIAPQQQCKDAQPIEEGRTNDYSKGNSEVYLANMHQALTLMYDCTPLKLDTVVVPAQGTAFVTKSYGKGKKGASKKYYNDAEWKALSYKAQVKNIYAMGDDGDDNKLAASAKSAKTVTSNTKKMKSSKKDNHRLKLKKSVNALQKCNKGKDDDLFILSAERSSHFRVKLQESHPKIALALKSGKSIGLDLRHGLLLDSQSCVATGSL